MTLHKPSYIHVDSLHFNSALKHTKKNTYIAAIFCNVALKNMFVRLAEFLRSEII